MNYTHILKNNFHSIESLFSFLEIPHTLWSNFLSKTPFPLNVPYRIASKMKKGDINDPLFLQFVPRVEEDESQEGFLKDPVADTSFQSTPHMLHKYTSRVLMLPTSACAMHCRYCFRRNFPYESTLSSFDKEVAYIENTPSITEVILSGGDPFSLPDNKLIDLCTTLSKIDHVHTIRFHTRYLIGIPERVTSQLLHHFSNLNTAIVIVLHINHPKEIDDECKKAFKKLHSVGCQLLVQSVLLKGVNDDVATLSELFTKCHLSHVLPYYLHHLDKVEGSHTFYVEKDIGRELMNVLREELSGYLVPRYVVEIPHKKSKTPIS